MKKIYSFSLIVLACLSYAQVSLTALNTVYTQNFDVMASTTTYPTNWLGTTTLAVSNGSTTAGGVQNLGTTSASDRALGSVASNSVPSPTYGVSFTNNTGQTIDVLDISYTKEQWRTGQSATANETVSFFYSTDATNLSTGTWTNVSALNMTEILTTTTSGAAVDGNAVANRASVSSSITGLNISAGSTFWIRWVDDNAASADAVLAVDDFSLTPKNSTLSVNDISKTKNIFLKNTFVDNVLSFQTKGTAIVKLYNVSGQLVKSATVSATNSNLDVASLPKGNYVVTAELNGEKFSQKIIKK